MLELVAELGRPLSTGDLLAGARRRRRARPRRRRAGSPRSTRPPSSSARTRGLRFVVPGDDEWPTQLDDLRLVDAAPRTLGGVPLGLWVQGSAPSRRPSTRRSPWSARGRPRPTATTVAGEIGALLPARAGRSVSGAAFGIDHAAHRGALAVERPTVAVLACGADRVYPAAHRELLDHLADARRRGLRGAARAARRPRIRFLARNRLIAALTRGTVVVEAAAAAAPSTPPPGPTASTARSWACPVR